MPKTYRKLEEIDFNKYIIDEHGIYSKHWKQYLNGKVTNEGYIVVSMCTKNGKKYQYPLHRIIAFCLISKPDYLKEIPYEILDVDHINGIRNDNRIENLRWCTHKENNSFDMAKANKSKSMKGKNSGVSNGNYGKHLSGKEKANLKDKLSNRSDLSKQCVKYDLNTGDILATYQSMMEASRKEGCKQECIARVCRGERHHYKGFGYKWI